MIAWAYIIAGSAAGVLGDVLGKLSSGHALWIYAAPAYLCFIAAIFCWIMALKTLPLIAAYTVWTGLAATSIVLIGWFYFGESINLVKLLLVLTIIACSIGLVFVENKGQAGESF